MGPKSHSIDFDGAGASEHYMTMLDYMEQYQSLCCNHDLEGAKTALEQAVECSYLPAIFELARFLVETPGLTIPQHERYLRAEQLYRSIINLLEIENHVTSMAALELASLYCLYLRRPIGSLAMLLRAKRFGANIIDADVDWCMQQIQKTDIHALGNNKRDAFDLGIELSIAGCGARITELVLREATETDDNSLRGMAYLALADFYNDHRNENAFYAKEAMRCYNLAALYGFPEYYRAQKEH